MKQEWSETRHKSKGQTRTRTTICLISSCPLPTPQTSPLPLPQASPSTWTPLRPSLSDLKPTPLWSTGRTPSLSWQQLWRPPMSLVSCSFPLNQCALLLKGTAPQEERNSSSLHKDWQELHERIKKSDATIKSNWKYSASKERIWQSVRCMQLIWKKPTSTGRKTQIGETLPGIERHKGWRGMKKMKDMSLISSSQSLTVTTPSTSLPPISNKMDCTAWALLALMSPSTDTSYSHINISPSMRRGSSPTGSSKPSPMTPHTPPCTTIPKLGNHC